MRYLLLILPLAACDAGHLGNPLLLPVTGIATGFENATYNARRKQVFAFLEKNRLTLSNPAVQSELWEIAKTPKNNQAKALSELHALQNSVDWTEQATVIVMVHS